MLKCKITRMFNSAMVLLTLLALTEACSIRSTSPPAASEQAPGQQSVLPTPEFDTLEIEPDAQMSPLPTREPSHCPDLDSQLFQITQAPDPLDLAEELQFKIRKDKIQVLLILDRNETDFLRDFEVELGTQSGTQVQAFVPIGQLCDLANTDQVLAIRPLAQIAP